MRFSSFGDGGGPIAQRRIHLRGFGLHSLVTNHAVPLTTITPKPRGPVSFTPPPTPQSSDGGTSSPFHTLGPGTATGTSTFHTLGPGTGTPASPPSGSGPVYHTLPTPTKPVLHTLPNAPGRPITPAQQAQVQAAVQSLVPGAALAPPTVNVTQTSAPTTSTPTPEGMSTGEKVGLGLLALALAAILASKE